MNKKQSLVLWISGLGIISLFLFQIFLKKSFYYEKMIECVFLAIPICVFGLLLIYSFRSKPTLQEIEKKIISGALLSLIFLLIISSNFVSLVSANQASDDCNISEIKCDDAKDACDSAESNCDSAEASCSQKD